MKKLCFLLLAWLFIFTLNFENNISFAQAQFELGNKIDIIVSGKVSFDESEKTFNYIYTIKSNPKSEQNVWRLEIIYPDTKMIINASSPIGWYKPYWSGQNNFPSPPPFGISWGAPKNAQIAPGDSLSNFSFSSYGLPRITDYYAEGYHKAPWFPAGSAPESNIPGYHDLTPYGPGVIGKTIGPTAPPADFKPVNFINYIINLKHQAYSLGWITNKGIENSLDAKLDNAKKKIVTGDVKTAKNILNAFINEIAAQNGKHLTSEAYGLLKYNLQYLIDRLQQ